MEFINVFSAGITVLTSITSTIRPATKVKAIFNDPATIVIALLIIAGVILTVYPLMSDLKFIFRKLHLKGRPK
jgi:hypothetical protein